MTSDEESSRVNMPYLPDDLLLNCLARVSRLYYPILSLVSKRFRSLIASHELYQIRTLLRRTESCLYVCLRLSSGSKQRWFTLSQRPTRVPNPNPNPSSGCFTPCFRLCTRMEDKKPSGNLLVSVQATHNSSPLFWQARAAIGSNIYTIGESSSKVFFLDCRSNTWHEAPSMQIARRYPVIRVLNGKLHVLEIGMVHDPSNSMEIFDPKTQVWEHVSCPRAEILGQSSGFRILAKDGKFYVFGDKNMVYKPEENKWSVVQDLDMRLSWAPYTSSCVIENVMYSSKMSRRLKWYDSERKLWRGLKGLGKLPKLPNRYSRVRLVNYGGKIAVLWDKKVRAIGSDKKRIWCAVIAVERRSNEQEIYGKIEWCDVVLTVPKSCKLLQILAVTV
ncbi:unnamed protein product [Microthlaspi erraticum]|uniref:F-box domain-containing protein n=1 Tax=Microthlaspi erraticum TaxID=1685480 RepID=A0A6D2HUN4_9BRAS|nr:unnamed protein product [Microthlaspi erraticum]CAA7018552.1 unnamed protein product [Microthlaspi erraticum]